MEQHLVDGELKTLLVHRKGATRAFPPHHPLVPVDYQFIGQPVIVGGTMGTCSYVLTGTQKGMAETFGSTCHGAGRAKSRSESRYVFVGFLQEWVGEKEPGRVFFVVSGSRQAGGVLGSKFKPEAEHVC